MAIKKASSQTWVNKGTTSAAVSSQNMITTAPFSAGQISTVPSGFVIPVTANNAALGGSIYRYSPGGPSITTITITDSNYTAIDDTALNTQGGYLVIQGTGFVTGAVVYVQGVACLTTTVMSSTEMRVRTGVVNSGTLQVYVINPDNSVGFKVSGVLTSGVPNWITTSPFAEQLDNLAFSIALTANSDSTITYTVQNGSSLPANTTLTTTGIFSGTISGLSQPTTYSFNVVATDAELQDTAKTFVVNVVVGDPYFPQVASLLKMEANTWITDTSNNKFNANVTGGAGPAAFSPFNDDGLTGSAYFDGSGDYLDWPNNNAFGVSTGDFTIEGWVYYIGGAYANNKYFIDFRPGATGGLYPVISANATGNIIFNTNSSNVIIGNAVTTNVWHHIALSRYNGDTRLFLDGVVQGIKVSDANNYLPGPIRVGRNNDGGTENAFNGFMSNLRVTKNVSYYQGNTTFTPSTTTLTRDTANTSLLTLQFRMGENGYRFVDTSAANSTTKTSVITRGGDANMSQHSPFTRSYWSVMLDNSQGITFDTPPVVVANANTGVTNTFTIETWINPQYVFGFGNPFYIYNVSNSFTFYTNYANSPYVNGGGRWIYISWRDRAGASAVSSYLQLDTSAGLIPMKKWTHVACVVNQNVIKLFINGIDQTANCSYFTNSTQYAVTGNNNLNLYQSYGGALTYNMGHIGVSGTQRLSDYRISTAARYWESNFDPPKRPYGSPDRTTVYAFNSQYIKDNNTQQPAKFTGVGGYAVPDGPYIQNTAYTPASVGGSFQLDGTGDYIAITPYNVSPTSANTNLSVLDQDFCFETWFIDTYSSNPGNSRLIVDTRPTGVGAGQFYLETYSASIVRLYMSTDGSSFNAVNGPTIGTMSVYQWIHVAVYRIGSTIYASCNGNVSVVNTSIGTASLMPLRNDMTLGISSQDKTSNPFFGYVGPTRLVIGDSVYSANVCPIPTGPFTRTANTKLLLNYDTCGIYDIAGGKTSFAHIGGCRVRNTNTKYSNNSIYFNRVDAYMTQRYHTFQGGAGEWNGSYIAAGDYTFECWIYPISTGVQMTIADWRTTEPQANPLIYIDTGNVLNYWISGATKIGSVANALPANNWSHFAVSRSNVTGTKMFINGLQVGATYADQNAVYSGIKMFIGGAYDAATLFGGYMEDIRLTLGYARYTTNTAAPTRAFSMR